MIDLIDINGRRYAAGLEWHYTSGRVRDAVRAALKAEQEARSASANDPGDVTDHTDEPGTDTGALPELDARAVLRAPPGSVQVGLGSTGGRTEIYRQPALAACLATAFDETSWIALLAIDDERSVLIAVRDGVIQAGGDAVAPHADARALYDELVELYGADAWPGGDHVETEPQKGVERLAGWLSHCRRPARVEPLSGRSIPRRQVVAAATVAGVVVVAWVVWPMLTGPERPVTRDPAPERSAEDASGPPPLPHTGAPRPVALVDRCREQLGRQPVRVKGWTLQEWVCQPGSVELTWLREHGQFLQRPAGARYDRSNPEQARATHPLATIEQRQRARYTEADVALARLLDIARTFGYDPSYEVRRNAPGTVDDRETNGAPVHGIPWTFTGNVSPSPRLARYLGEVPGLVVNTIEWRLEEQVWTVEGQLYVAL